MARDTSNGHVDRAGSRQSRTFSHTDLAGLQIGSIVKSQHVVGLRKLLKQASIQHRFGAAASFLGGLANHDHGTPPPILELAEQAGSSNEAGHVNIVTASVHDAHFVALVIFGLHPAGIFQTGLLCHRQRIEIRSNHHRRASTIPQHADQAVSSKISCHFKPNAPEFLLEALRSLGFVE